MSDHRHSWIDGVCTRCGTDKDSAETLSKVKDYAENLHADAQTSKELEIATDILYLIGEKD